MKEWMKQVSRRELEFKVARAICNYAAIAAFGFKLACIGYFMHWT